MVKLTEFIQKIVGFGWESWQKTGSRLPTYVLIRKRTQKEEFEEYLEHRRKKYMGA